MKTNVHYLIRILFEVLILVLVCVLFGCTDEGPEAEYSAPMLSVSGTNNVGRTSVTVSGQFDGKLTRVKEYGVKYSTSSTFPKDQTTYVSFEGTPKSGSFSTQLTGLNSNTQYYYCLYATTSGISGIEVTSDPGSFSTVSTSKPTFDEISVDSVGENVVVVRFRISEIGDEYLVEQGVSYRKKASGTTEDTYVPYTTDSVSDAANLEYVAVLYNLSAKTTYEIRPYAKNSSDPNGDNGMIEGYGEVQTFTTQDQKSAVVETYDITSGNIGISSVMLSGIVTSAPGSNGVLDEVGFCYSENRQEPTWQDNTIQITDELKLNTAYTCTLPGLKENTTYYVRMYAKNMVDGSARYGYGETKTFTTNQLSTPIFDDFTNVETEAQQISLTANLSNYDEEACVERGFYWATSVTDCTLEKASKLGNSVKVTDGGRAFSTTITGLKVGVLYYIAAYAVYKSDQKELTGSSDPYPVNTQSFSGATLSTPLITDETYFGATVTGVIRSQGNGTITAKGFVVSRDYYEPTIDFCDFHAYGDDNFQYTFTELTQGTYYYVRAYVTSELDGQSQTVYSDYSSFNTQSATSAVLKDIDVTDLSTNSAHLTTGLNSTGDGTVTEAGFCWAASADVSETLSLDNATGKVMIEDLTNLDEFSLDATDLNYSTEYKCRGYVKTLVDKKLELVSYTGTIYFTTSNPQSASLSSLMYSNVSLHTMDVAVDINATGDGNVVEKGFCWVSTASISYWTSVTLDNAEGHVAVWDGTDTSFSATLTGLTAGTEYRVAAYVINEYEGVKRYSYSNYYDITTSSPQLPQMNAPTVTSVSFFDATFKMNIYDEGNYTINKRGVCLSATRSDPILSDCDFTVDFVYGNDSCTVYNLTSNTTYYVRSFVTCTLEDEEQTVYSSYRRFSTSSITEPEFKSIELSNATFTSIDASCGIRELGDGTITEKGFCWVIPSEMDSYYTSPTLDNAKGYLAVTNNDSVDFKATLSNLSMSTQYRVAAYAKYQVDNYKYTGVVYSGYSTLYTITPELPSLGYASVSDITYNSAKFTRKLSREGNYEITESGVVLSASNVSPDIYTNDASGKFGADSTCTVTGLQTGTIYYYRSYAKCKLNYEEKIVYSSYTSLYVSSAQYPTLAVPSTDSITYSSVDLKFAMESSGDYTVTERGLCISSKTSIPTTTNYEYIKKLEGDATTYTLTGLTPGNTYYVRSYVVCQLEDDVKTQETRYSGSNNFTTTNITAASYNSIEKDSITITTVNMKASIGELGDGELVEHGFIWKLERNGSNLTVDNCEGILKVDGTDKDYSATITGLLPGNWYYVRAYAKTTLDGNEVYGYSDNSNPYASSISLGTSATAIGNTSESISITYNTNAVSVVIKECGIVYSKENIDADQMTEKVKATVNEDNVLQYAVSLEELESNVTYYYYVYSTFEGGTVYSSRYSFTTKTIPTIDDNVSPSKRD